MYTETEARELVLEAGLKLLENKLIARTWGNISARISEEQFVITPSGRAYDSLKPEDLVVVNIADLSHEGDIKPSSEKGVHAACYELRPECNFVIHTHQFYASAIAADEKSTDFAPCAGYGLPGTGKLKKNVYNCIRDNKEAKMFFMAKHGTVLAGDSFQEAFELAEELENKSRELFEKKVPHYDDAALEDIDLGQIEVEGFPCVVLQQDQFVKECCIAGIRLKPFIDDFAQIVGPDAACVENKPQAIMKALKNRNAVLVRGVGAVCTGVDETDAEAVSMIVSKNCACACYARNSKPIGPVDANLMRTVYLNSYSKQKHAQDEA